MKCNELMRSAEQSETFIEIRLFEVRVGILQKWVIFLVISNILGNELFLVRQKHEWWEGWTLGSLGEVLLALTTPKIWAIQKSCQHSVIHSFNWNTTENNEHAMFWHLLVWKKQEKTEDTFKNKILSNQIILTSRFFLGQ